MTNFVVFVPGIMGSELTQTIKDTSGNQTTYLWSEDALGSVWNLAKAAQNIKFNPGTPVNAPSIIRKLNMDPTGLFFRKQIYGPMIEGLQAQRGYDYIAFPYDWRASIADAAQKLGARCKALKARGGAEAKISFVGHSMGGLVIAYALVSGLINPGDVGKVCTVGTPFGGSPSAFKALYYSGHVPGTSIFLGILEFFGGMHKYRELLLDATKSFASVYQLLPNKAFNFITLQNNDINLLAPPGSLHIVDQTMVQEANDCHDVIKDLDNFKKSHLGIYFLHIVDIGFPTDYRYEADFGKTFENIRQKERVEGDKTVPGEFAKGKAETIEIYVTSGCEHMTMCANKAIVSRVKLFLS